MAALVPHRDPVNREVSRFKPEWWYRNHQIELSEVGEPVAFEITDTILTTCV